MSKPLVTPPRYVVRCYFSDGTERELVFPENSESDGVPSAAPTLIALMVDELVDGLRYGVTTWYSPHAR